MKHFRKINYRLYQKTVAVTVGLVLVSMNGCIGQVGLSVSTLSTTGAQLATLPTTSSNSTASTSPQIISISLANPSTISTPVVQEGQSIQIVADRAVTWKFIGNSGKLSATTSTSAQYTAPSSVVPLNSMGGCPLFPNDSIYNTRIDNLPVAAMSAEWTNPTNVGTNSISFLPSWGHNVADHTTPVVKESFYYTTGNNGPWIFPQWPLLVREGGVFQTDQDGSDHHVVTIDHENCQIYETYNNYFSPRNCRDGSSGCTATSGWSYNGNQYEVASQGSTDAAGLPLSSLVYHLSEIKSGAIHHPIRFTLINSYIYGGTQTWPATTAGGWASTSSAPSYGARYRLKSSFDISQFSSTAQVILTALKQYGMILADAGTGPTLITDTDVNLDEAVVSAFSEIQNAHITLPSFEVVDSSSLMLDSSSVRVNPNNPYVAPLNSAAILVTDASNSANQVTLPISLQGVAISLPSAEVTVLAGTPGYALQSFVNGTPNQGVIWSLVSGVGSVTPAGVYTAPNTVSGVTPTVLKVTSQADANASQLLYVNVIPWSNDGTIRIAAGQVAPLVDGNKNTWTQNIGMETGLYHQWASDYPNWPNQTNPEISVYEGGLYSYGNDILYNFVVPNGNYKVRFLFGYHYECYPGCQTFNPKSVFPIDLEANGQIALHNYDWGAAIGYAYATPTDAFIPASVTNNNLAIVIRGVSPDGASTSIVPMLQGLQIIPDSNTQPHLAIDLGGVNTVLAGDSVQVNAVGWYMSNAVTWSLLSGAGTLSSTGVYTAPQSPSQQNQTATIQAISTANPNMTATATITILPGSIAVSPSTLSLIPMSTQQFTVSLNGSSYSNLNWSISPQIGSISSTGLYTAPTTPLSQSAVITVTATSKDDPSLVSTAMISIAAGVQLRVNSGGAAFVDANGNNWMADFGYNSNSTSYDSGPGAVGGTTSDLYPVYNSSRYQYYGTAFDYQFSIPNGQYQVTLMFNDDGGNNTSTNFNVAANGVTVVSNLNVDSVVGPNTAYNATFPVVITGNNLRLDFLPNNLKSYCSAFVNGIQIIYTGP